ncbi:MAG: hypothetical protein ACQESF_00220 [Nanobdellota archaeon]
MGFEKKADIGFWLVKLIIALVTLFIIIMIISQANSSNMDFLNWLRDIL